MCAHTLPFFFWEILGTTDLMGHVFSFTHFQINKENGMVEASRIMNLYQFIQLYRDITSQATEVLSAEVATEGPSAQLTSTDSCQASMWMGRSVPMT